MTKGTPELDQLFPRVVSADEDEGLDHLATKHEEFVNYSGVEENDAAAEQIEKFKEQEFVSAFDSLQAARAHLGADPVLSKLGVVTQEKRRPNGDIVTKTRIIGDNKEAGVSTTAKRTHRSTLPRATNAIGGVLGLMRNTDDSLVYLLIADVRDAFWLIPLAWEERRFFVAKFRGQYLVFNRTAQGSRAAPLTWAAVAALFARCVQSTFLTADGWEAKLQMYVDDPLLALKGSDSRRARLVARFLAIWLLLGVDLAFDKAKLDTSVVWIGIRLSVFRDRVVASAPTEKASELLELVETMLRKNVVSVLEVRSLAGKAMNVASLLFVWRPFLSAFWAAITTATGSPAVNCIWVKQIAVTLCWLQASLIGRRGHIERIFTLDFFTTAVLGWKSRLMRLHGVLGLGFR